MKPKNARISRSGLAFAACAAAALVLSCTAKPLPIGFIGPLSGPSSAVGLGGRNGFLLAFGDGPEAAPGKIGRTRLLVEDDENDQGKCLTAVQRLKDEGCRLIVLGSTSQAAQKAIPWALGAGMLVVSPTVSDPTFSGRDDLFFRVNESSDAYGKMLAETIYRRYGILNAGVIGDARNKTYATAVRDAFMEKYAAYGGRTAFNLQFDSAEGIPGEELEQQLAKTGTKTLVAITASAEAVKIAKRLEKDRTGIRLFLPPWPLTLDLIRNGGEAVEGTVAVSIADLEYRSATAKKFYDGYMAEYGEPPSFTAMFGWEGAAILRRALADAKTASAEAVKDRILKTGTFQGIQGNIVFDANGDASRDKFLFEIKKGKFVRVE